MDGGMCKTAARRFATWTFLLFVLSVPLSGRDDVAIRNALSHPNLKDASVGVEVRSVKTGKILFARKSRTPLIPASNCKLVTVASALHHLGEDYTFLTRIYVRGTVLDGRLAGDLVLRGGGDPAISDRFREENPLAPLKELARAVSRSGVREVSGFIVLDDTLFDREYVAPGWPQDQLNHSYCAPCSGLSIMENLVWIEVRPGAGPGRDAASYLFPNNAPFEITGRVLTTARTNENIVHIDRPGTDGRIRISGRTYFGNSPSRFSVSVRRPTEYFGSLFMHALEEEGVDVEGGFILAPERPDYGSDAVRLLGEVSSDLRQVALVTNKMSVNHCAEQLFKLAGWKVAGKGTFASGEAAVRKMFSDLGIEDMDPFHMEDGSGLSRNNSMSAHTLVSLLCALYTSPVRDTFLRTLPISGMDGSLEERLAEDPFRSRVRAKTGWIREVSALSGYVQSLSGDIFAFSILINGYKGRNVVMKSIQDDICRILVEG